MNAGTYYSPTHSLGSSRFLRATRIRHPLGSLVVKTFIKPDPSMRLNALMRRLQCMYRVLIKVERQALEDVPNVLATQQVIETEAAAYLVRQWLACSLYDRISTRPFITEMEKLWISYQILYAIQAAHERNIAHGDLKCENVLVTSSLDVYVTDFASSFKPTYLPLDDPADFSLFFDTSGRRTCYVAPERFYDSVSDLPSGSNPMQVRTEDVENVSDVLTYEPYLEMLGLGRPNGRITEAMDVFSLGCVLAELWRDGTPLFTLSQLFRYRRGDLDIDGALDEIQHAGIRNLVRRMLHLDPAQRPRLQDILSQEQKDIFPPSFSGFFHLYLVDLQRPVQLSNRNTTRLEARNSERDLKMDRLTRQVEADDRIEKMYEDWSMIVQFFHQGHTLSGEDVFLGVYIPGLALRPYMARKSAGKDAKALIVLNILLANLRHCQRASSRCHAIELILHLAWGWLNDEAILDRVLPYLATMLDDKSATVRALAIHGMASALECIHEIPPTNDGIWTEFVLPSLTHLTADSSPYVRTTSVMCLTRFAQSMMRLCRTMAGASFDEDMQTLQGYVQEQLTRLVTDSSCQVRRAVLVSAPILFTLLGPERLPSVILSHVLTYLNEEQGELRAMFFQTMAHLVSLFGAHWMQKYIQPLLPRSLSDGNELVLVRVLQYIQACMHAFDQASMLEILPYIATFLCHPNVWIREASVGVFAKAAENTSATDKWIRVYLFLRPFLRCDVTEMTPLAIWNALEAPIPTSAWNACVLNLKIDTESVLARFWRAHAWRLGMDEEQLQEMARENMDTIVRPPFVSRPRIAPSSEAERNMLQELQKYGLDLRYDLFKVAALWWYLEQMTYKLVTPGPVPSLSLQGLTQHSIFFTQHPANVVLPSQDSVRMARNRLESNENLSLASAKAEKGAVLPVHEQCRDAYDTDAYTIKTEKSDTASISERSIKLPLFGTPSVASASTSLVHAHAERARIQRSERFTRGRAREEDQFSSVNHTFEGKDPYVHAHLGAVLGQIHAHVSTDTALEVRTTASWGGTLSNPRPQGTLLAYYEEHKDRVTALAVSQDQMFFVSGSDDGMIKVWDTARLEKNVTTHSRLTYASHGAPITDVLVLRGTHCIFSTARDGSIHAWGIALQTKASLPHYSRPHVLGRKHLDAGEYVVCMSQLSYGAAPTVLLGTNYGRLIWWDVRTMRPTYHVAQPASFGSITCMVIDPQSHWVCTGSSRGFLGLWDLRFSLLLRKWTLGDHSLPVHACQLHPQRKNSVIVAWGTCDSVMATLDLESSRSLEVWHVATMDRLDEEVDLPDTLLFKELPEGHERIRIKRAIKEDSNKNRYTQAVHAVLASVEGYSSTSEGNSLPAGYVITAGADRVLRFWDLGSAEKSVAWGCEVHGEFFIQEAQQRHYAYSGSLGERLSRRSPLCVHEQTNSGNTFAKSHKDLITCIARLEAPFRCIVAGDRAGTLRIWE